MNKIKLHKNIHSDLTIESLQPYNKNLKKQYRKNNKGWMHTISIGYMRGHKEYHKTLETQQWPGNGLHLALESWEWLVCQMMVALLLLWFAEKT